MATMFEECITEEQRSVMRLFGVCAIALNAKDIHKEMFPFYGGNSLKDVRKSLTMPDQVWKWLRQQSKDLYAAGFDALIKRWGKCTNVAGGYVEK
jgi:hypothetical protein